MYEKRIEIIKVPTEENMAVVLTKAVDSTKLEWHIGAIHACTSKDRHGLTPGLDYGKEEGTEVEEEE